ncbi:MAG: matrixin family metalloprotease [bacterium]
MNRWRVLAIPALLLLGLVLFAGNSQAFELIGLDWNWLGGFPIVVDVRVNPNCNDPGATNELGACQNGMNTWSNSGAAFNFNYAGYTSVTNASYNGHNDMCWSSSGGGGALATTYMWGSGGNMSEADVVFWDSWNWDSGFPSYNEFDVQSVATHELGHVLGLDHTPISAAIMYYAIGYGQIKRTLHQDDIDGITYIYGPMGGNLLSNDIYPTSSVNLPGTGGNIYYELYVYNNTSQQVIFDAWSWYELSGGGYSQNVINRSNVVASPNVTINRSLWLTISGSVPNGTYFYNFVVADYYGAPPYDQDYFEFFKYGDDSNSPWIADNSSGGWDDELITTGAVIPESFQVSEAYPNPFNPETKIEFDLPKGAELSLAVYNLQGRKVTELVSGYFDAGHYGVTWNAAGYPSGTYLYRLSSDLGMATGKLVLLK